MWHGSMSVSLDCVSFALILSFENQRQLLFRRLVNRLTDGQTRQPLLINTAINLLGKQNVIYLFFLVCAPAKGQPLITVF